MTSEQPSKKVSGDGALVLKLIGLKLLALTLFGLACYFWDDIAYSKSDHNEIEQVWRNYYSPSIDLRSKVDLMSFDYRNEYMSNIKNAYSLPKEKLERLSFAEKLRILQLKHQIVEKDLTREDLLTFSQAFVALQEDSGLSMISDLDSGLRHIQFENRNEAYGSYNLFLAPKASQFVKENGKWRINPYVDHNVLDDVKAKIMYSNITRYGGENIAIDSMISIATESEAMWEPLD